MDAETAWLCELWNDDCPESTAIIIDQEFKNRIPALPVSKDLGFRGRVLQVGWELPSDLSETEWREAGAILRRVEHSAHGGLVIGGRLVKSIMVIARPSSKPMTGMDQHSRPA